jgi:hypothetical protein
MRVEPDAFQEMIDSNIYHHAENRGIKRTYKHDRFTNKMKEKSDYGDIISLSADRFYGHKEEVKENRKSRRAYDEKEKSRMKRYCS